MLDCVAAQTLYQNMQHRTSDGLITEEIVSRPIKVGHFDLGLKHFLLDRGRATPREPFPYCYVYTPRRQLLHAPERMRAGFWQVGRAAQLLE